ncbi:MAG: CpsD/CapB family tyrosine-protein kinase [Patescibacteria group bacterium]|nr:CpsD/CapB family tyrosine-protein kinase [Patescibacteria group bacterium]
MELKEIFQIIKRKIWLIILVVVIVVGSTTYLSLKQKIKYETSSILTIQANHERTDQYQYNGYYAIQACDFFINTITGWIGNPSLVSKIYEGSGSGSIYSQKIPPQNLVLVATGETKEQSDSILDGMIKLIKDKNAQLNIIDGSMSGFEIISSDFTTIPTKTNVPFNIIVSLIVSLFLSLFLVFFLEYLSPTINNLQRIKNIFKKQPISLRGLKLKKLVRPTSVESEKFRFLRANITSLDQNEKTSIVVAGINEKNITPLISANLALSFARSGKRTILVDANFSNPNIHEYFNRGNEAGFSEFLFDEKNIDKYLQKTDETNLRIMSSGIKLSYASDTIERSDLKEVLREIEKECDVVIINVPALNASSEAFPLFSIIKKILLVVKLGKTNILAVNYINDFVDRKEVEKYIVVI